MELYVSRAMLVRHSQDVVSGCPVPIYLACRRSSSCCVRSLSAWSRVSRSVEGTNLEASGPRGRRGTHHVDVLGRYEE